MRYRHGHTHTHPTTSTGVLGDVHVGTVELFIVCVTLEWFPLGVRYVAGAGVMGWSWPEQRRNQLIDGVFVQTPYVTKFASNDMERVINRNIRPMAG